MQPVEKYFEPHDYINDEPHYHCAYCGWLVHVDETTVDHVIPSSRGGTNHKSNLLPCCYKCNQDKGNLLLSEWVEVLENKRVKETVRNLINYFDEEKAFEASQLHSPLLTKPKSKPSKLPRPIHRHEKPKWRYALLQDGQVIKTIAAVTLLDESQPYRHIDGQTYQVKRVITYTAPSKKLIRTMEEIWQDSPIFDYDTQGNIVRVDSN